MILRIRKPDQLPVASLDKLCGQGRTRHSHIADFTMSKESRQPYLLHHDAGLAVQGLVSREGR
jgi:hypothetical protein